jgi:hypothetical protein
MGGEYY